MDASSANIVAPTDGSGFQSNRLIWRRNFRSPPGSRQMSRSSVLRMICGSRLLISPGGGLETGAAFSRFDLPAATVIPDFGIAAFYLLMELKGRRTCCAVALDGYNGEGELAAEFVMLVAMGFLSSLTADIIK
jgi:hypothetical protein